MQDWSLCLCLVTANEVSWRRKCKVSFPREMPLNVSAFIGTTCSSFVTRSQTSEDVTPLLELGQWHSITSMIKFTFFSFILQTHLRSVSPHLTNLISCDLRLGRILRPLNV